MGVCLTPLPTRKIPECFWENVHPLTIARDQLHLSVKIEESKISQIQKLCKENQVKSLFAFGSVTREDFHENSDVDLVVDFEEEDPFKYTDLYFNLKLKLEEILKRHVDLLEERGIRNKFFRQDLDNTKIKIYGQ